MDVPGVHLGTSVALSGEKDPFLGETVVHLGAALSSSGVASGSVLESKEDLLVMDMILAEEQIEGVAPVIGVFLLVTGASLGLPGRCGVFGVLASSLTPPEKVLTNVFLVKVGKVLLLIVSSLEVVAEVVVRIVVVVDEIGEVLVVN